MTKRDYTETLNHAVGLLIPETDEGHIRASAAVAKILDDFDFNQRSALTWGIINSELKEIEHSAIELLTKWNSASAITRNRICSQTEKFDNLEIFLRSLAQIASKQAEEIEVVREDNRLKGKAGSFPEPDHLMIEFVRDCLRVFESFRPEEASTTKGGPFPEFVSAVHELRTGDKGIYLTRRINQVIRDWRVVQKETSMPKQSTAEIVTELNAARGKRASPDGDD